MGKKPTYEELEQRIRILEEEVLEHRRLREVQWESNDRYQMLIETMYDGFGMQDRNGVFTYVNRRLCEILGYESNELIGRRVMAFLNEENQGILKEQLDRRQKGKFNSYELVWMGKDGKRIFTIVSPNVVYDKNGELAAAYAVVTDISERMAAEKELAYQTNRLGSLIEHSALAIVTLDEKHNIVSFNQCFEALFQFKESDVAGKNLDEVIAGQRHLEEAASYTTKTLQGEAILGSGKRYRKDGTLIDVEFHGVPVVIDGAVIGAFGLYQDISERRESEKALQESEKRFRIAAESASDLIYEWDVATDHLEWFGDIDKALGYEPGQFDRTIEAWLESIHPDDQDRLAAAVNHHRKTGDPLHIEYSIRRKDGTWRYWTDRGAALVDQAGKPYKLIGVCSDITEQRQAAEALRQSEKRYRELADSLPQIVFETDKTGKLIFVNRNAFDLFGYSQHDFDRGVTALEMLIPEDRNRAMQNIQRVMLGEDSSGNEYTALRKDGSTFPVSIHANALIGEDKPVGMRGIIIDLSQKKEAEEALQQSEARYRSLVENTMDGYFVCEIPSGRFVFLNQRSCDLHGYTMKEGLELTVWEVMSPVDHGRIRERIQARLEHKDLSSELQTYTAVRKDGSSFRGEISTSLVSFQGITGVQGIIRDITEQECLERQLQQAQKMEAVGTLAGGIAHDFNNLLMGIQGRASLLLMRKDSAHADFEHLKGIEDYVKSAADLTRQLLGFARGGKYEVRPTDLNGLLKKSSEMFGRTKKEITIHPKYQKDLWAVEADPGQIEQVLLNLYVNAWQAMPGGGELYLETQNMVIDENNSKPYHVEAGKCVKISITDTGSGMDEATRKRIFDPFFTTKEMGRGTGLGLASVYGIIKGHGGFIDVYSEKGHGTTFKIHLPAMKTKGMRQRAETDNGLEMARGAETILLVDDEDMIIEVGTELLREMGYRVLIARSGREAIEIVSESSAPDLVILDMIMPGMGGGETYDRLKEINTGIKVLLSSGYSKNGQATEILERGCNGFIQKPFNVVELSQKLREILELTIDY